MDIDSFGLQRNQTVQSSRDCPDVGLAAFIVGSLCHEGYVPLNLNNSDSKQDFMGAIALTAAILTQTKATDDGGMTQLPFDW
jgi:hypothetical protein